MADYQCPPNYRGLPSSGNPQGRPQASLYGPGHTQSSPRDPALRTEDHTTLPMSMSISTSDLDNLESCRESVKRDFVSQPPHGGANFFSVTSSYTLTFPSLKSDPPPFKKFVYDKLVDKDIQRHLEDGHVINWCESVSKLIPLSTLRDGNCLLHAASLAMWGFQDRNTTLRGALSTALSDTSCNTLYQRWKYNHELENRKVGLELEPQQWDREWQDMVRQASPEVQGGQNFDSLDDFHIFVLANVLRRPVIMYASSKYRSVGTDGTLQETNIQGVYLPLLWDPKVCKRDPLPLAYDGGHFTALVVPEYGAMTQDGMFILPLVDYNGKELSKKFTLHMEDNTSLIMDYLSPIQRPCNLPYSTTSHIFCANLAVVEPPGILKSLMSSFLQACRDAYRREVGTGQGPAYGLSGRDDRGGGDMRAVGRDDMYAVGRGEGRGGGGGGGDRYAGRDEGRDMYAVGRGGGGDRYAVGRGGDVYEGRDMYAVGRGEGGDKYAVGRGGGGGGYAVGRGEGSGGGDGYGDGRGGGVREGGERVKCVNSCGNYGDADYNYLCVTCYRKHMEQLDQPNTADEAGRGGNKFGGGDSQRGVGGGGGGSIKCPKCSKPGNPQLLGMCQGCFSSNAAPHEAPHDKESIYEPLPGDGSAAATMGGYMDEPPSLPLPRNAKERSLCRKPGCKYYGTQENRFYCSRCFELDMENILKEVDDGVPLMPGPPAEEPFSHAQQPPYQPAGGDPPKCYWCNNFYANEEYGGLCNNCFMKSTLGGGGGGGGPMSPRDRQSQDQRHSSVKDTHDNFTPNPSYAPVFNPTAPQGVYRNPSTSQYQPAHQDQRERRAPTTTQPITTLESKMADIAMTSRCFLCNPGQLGDSSQFTVCRNHAADMYKMMQHQQQHGGDMGGRGGEREDVGRRRGEREGVGRRGGEREDVGRRGGEREDVGRRGGEGRGDREDEVRSKLGRGSGAPSYPQQTTGNVSEPEWSGKQPAPGAPYQNYGGEHVYENGGNGQRRPNIEQPHHYVNDPQTWSDQPPYHGEERRFSNEPNYPPHPTKEPRRFGNEQEYPVYGNERHEDDFSQEQGNVRGYPPQAAGRGGGAEGVARRAVGEGSKEEVPKVKLLCAQTGCSFRGYKELKDLCPDCYREYYNSDFDSKEFPLA